MYPRTNRALSEWKCRAKTPHHGIYANKLTQILAIVNQNCIEFLQKRMILVPLHAALAPTNYRSNKKDNRCKSKISSNSPKHITGPQFTGLPFLHALYSKIPTAPQGKEIERSKQREHTQNGIKPLHDAHKHSNAKNTRSQNLPVFQLAISMVQNAGRKRCRKRGCEQIFYNHPKRR